MAQESQWLRIAELERRSDFSRRTIHFYLREGLLPPPIRTGRTMAYYSTTHLDRLAYIRQARERGLPLVAIRRELAENPCSKKAPVPTAEPGGGRPGAGRHASRTSPETAVPGNRRSTRVEQEGQLQAHQDQACVARRQGSGRMREDILAAGCRAIRQKGYRGTRVSDITRELGIGKGTFYFYFSDKKELFLECVPRIFAELFSRGWDRIRKETDPRRRLELRARAVLPVLQEFSTILQLSNEALEDEDPKLRQLGQQTCLSVRQPLEADIRNGIREGLFRDLDPRIAATFLIGIMNGLRFLQTVDKEPLSERTWNQVLDLMLHGMAPPGRY